VIGSAGPPGGGSKQLPNALAKGNAARLGDLGTHRT